MRESAVFAPLATGDVDPPTLHKMARETNTSSIGIECAIRELFIEKAEEATESRFIAAVRGCGQ
jgi:hypothetical protein